MYIPSAFRIDDEERLRKFVEANSFAAVVTSDLTASHLPMRMEVMRDGTQKLVGHMARANDQWKQFRSHSEVLTIFSGPHSYISPSWYETSPAVPTWNFGAVHIYGKPQLIEDHGELVTLLDETVQFYERNQGNPWTPDYPDDFRDKLIAAIVAFEIRITRIEGKFKLGQNRSESDIRGILNAVESSQEPQARLFAEFMRSVLFTEDLG